MKICFIANLNNIHSRRWIEPLIPSGHDIYLINYRSGAAPIKGSKEFIDLSTWFQPPKIRFAFWGLWVRQYISRIKPHILHAHQIHAAGWIGSFSGFHPFIVTAWGSDLLVEPLKSPFRRFLLKTVLARADHLTVPSKIMLEAAFQLGSSPHQVHLIPWGIDTDIFNPYGPSKQVLKNEMGIDPNLHVLLSPRRITPICNIDILIAALPKVLSLHPDIKLVLIDYIPDPVYSQKIKKQINQLGLQDHVLWHPARSSEAEMANLYRMADIVLSIPSSEGYGATVYEALSSGTPTVITNLPVFEKELIHEVHTMKVQVKNIDQTSAAIIRLLNDPLLCRKLIDNGLETCQTKSARKRVKRVQDLYLQIANHK